MKFIFETLCKIGLLEYETKFNDKCGIHPGDEHSIEDCLGFKKILQELMDRQIIQVGRQDLEEDIFAQMGDERNITDPKSLVVHFTKTSRMPERRQHVVIQAPSTFPYKNDKAVPWRYGVQVTKGGEQHTGAPAIDNIVGIGGMMRNGRIFAPRDLRRGQDHQERQRNEGVTNEKAKEFF